MSDADIALVREALLAANADVYGDEGNADSLAALSRVAARMTVLEEERDEKHRQLEDMHSWGEDYKVRLGLEEAVSDLRAMALRQAIAEIENSPYATEAWGWGISYRIDKWRAIARADQESP